MWFGLRIGLNYQQTHDIPFGELLDLIAIEQIKRGEANLYVPQESLDELLSVR